MSAWLAENWGTILLTLILAGIVTLIIAKLIKDRKNGKSSCGGNCSHCPGCGRCQKK